MIPLATCPASEERHGRRARATCERESPAVDRPFVGRGLIRLSYGVAPVEIAHDTGDKEGHVMGRSGVAVPLMALLVAVAVLALPVTAGAAKIPGQYIVVLKDSANVDAVVAQHKAKFAADVDYTYKSALKGYAAKLSASRLGALRADPSVLFVSQEREFAAPEPPEELNCREPGQGQPQCLPSGVDRIDGDLSSTRSGDRTGAVDVDVAVIDSGIDTGHDDLNVMGGVACKKKKQSSKLTPDDPAGHGTFVGGVIGARDNANGVVGVAPGARLWGARVVLDSKGSLPTSAILCAIDWVTSTRTDQNPANDIEVANSSFSSDAGTELVDDGNCGMSNKTRCTSPTAARPLRASPTSWRRATKKPT